VLIAPFIEECGEGTVEVVFEVRAGSRLWKDLVVDLVKGVPADAGTFVGFNDRVLGRLHPASAVRG
jgi:hypothetical protein